MTKNRLGTLREDLQPKIKELKYMAYLVKRSPLLIAGMVISVTITILAVVGPYIAPYHEFDLFLNDLCPFAARTFGSNYPCPPNAGHLLGTDNSGFDIYSRLLYATRLDIGMSFAVVSLASIIGVVFGAVAGYLGGKIDELIMRITDIFLAFPGLVLAIALAAVLGRNWNSVFIALLVVWWPTYVRLIRGQVLSVKENQFVEAARAVGAGTRRIVMKHIVPHVIPQMIVYATIDIGGVILTLAALGFLGLGGDPRTAEWGFMVSQNAGCMLKGCPWTIIAPGLAILLTSVGFNLIGDGMRDILDPRLRR